MSESIFQQYARHVLSPEETFAPDIEEEKPDYKAFAEDATKEKQGRLRIHYLDGTITTMAYAYLVETLCTSHQHLSLIYTNVVITLTGRNLIKLVEPLQDERIRSVQCFHAEHYEPPTEGEEPVITQIERQTLQALEQSLFEAAND